MLLIFHVRELFHDELIFKMHVVLVTKGNVHRMPTASWVVTATDAFAVEDSSVADYTADVCALLIIFCRTWMLLKAVLSCIFFELAEGPVKSRCHTRYGRRCSDHATCSDEGGNDVCVCNAGYFGNGFYCASTYPTRLYFTAFRHCKEIAAFV